jgi:hypothetical protein
MTSPYNTHLTQIPRTRISAPTRFLLESDLIFGNVLHHGAGRAQHDSVAMLRTPGVIDVQEYDPYGPYWTQRDSRLLANDYDVVVSNYVLNTLPPAERQRVVNELGAVSTQHLFIAVRSDKVSGTPYEDGVITSRGTFQRTYTPQEAQVEFGIPVVHRGRGFVILGH